MRLILFPRDSLCVDTPRTVTNCKLKQICNWIPIIGYPRDFHVNYARFNGFLRNVSYNFQNLRTHCCRHKCFSVCPRAQHLLRTQILCPGHKKCFLFCSETFCVRNKCFPVCAAQETSWATMCPRLPVPLLRYDSWTTVITQTQR